MRDSLASILRPLLAETNKKLTIRNTVLHNDVL